MSARALQAWIDDAPVGVLREAAGLWSFQYDEAWLGRQDSHALSPHLPLQPDPVVDGASVRPVQWYFDNLLPEEGQRQLLAGDAHIDVADAFGLLAWYGAESAGSVTLLPQGQLPAEPGGLRVLADADLSGRIQRLPKVPLTHGAVKRMSLAGAQHKLAVVVDEGRLFEPVGAQISTHILKPDHPDADYPHTVANEWFAMHLAGQLGLEVPRVERRYVPEPVYLIERFDRWHDGRAWHRRHALDACQLLGLDRSFKYSQGSVESLARLAEACRSPAQARTRLFSWLVFNLLVGNGDAHLKNLSFLATHEGIALAPHYDLLSTACYEAPLFGKQDWPGASRLAWPLQGVDRFAALDRNTLLDAGQVLNLSRTTARRLLDKQCQRILPLAEEALAQFEAQNTALVADRPALAPVLAGESRCVRGLVFVVIRDMVALFD